MKESRIDFFSKIENKYNIGLKRNRPIILRFDARNTTKNKEINLLDETKDSFSYALKETCKILSLKYQCLIYVACDEINIIIKDTKRFLKNFKSNLAQEITTTIGQEISFYFHQYYKKDFILFAGRCFSVYEDNINSYLIYRKHTNIPVLTIYFLKRHSGIDIHKKSYLELDKYAKENLELYNKRTLYQSEGIIYLKGKEYSIEDYLTNNIKETIILNNKKKDLDI